MWFVSCRETCGRCGLFPIERHVVDVVCFLQRETCSRCGLFPIERHVVDVVCFL